MDGERLDIDKALERLTLDEKLRMLSGDGMWHTFGVGDLPRIRMSDGPNGLRMTDTAMSSAVPATCFPTLSVLAASWDPAMVYSVGAGLGREATAMGVNLLLAPGVNIKRDPLCGRNFEYFSEDPLLAGELGKAYISGVQSTGVGACVKHFAANNTEKNRMYSDSVIDKRALNEVYLRPFRIALEAEPEAVMCAYNKLNGEYCSQNKSLLTDILRTEWSYTGTVISDWGAVRDRAAALKAGLDLAMPDSSGLFEEQLRSSLASGDITEADVDRSVARILKLTDNVYLEPYGDFDADSHDLLAYNAAAAGLVMLKNDGMLPLTKDMKIAVVGELAASAPVQGGGSACVSPLKTRSPIDAFSQRGIEVSYLRGYSVAEPKLNEKLLKETLDGCSGSNGVVVFVGQEAPCEGLDRDSLDLPSCQNALIDALVSAGHKVTVVVCSIGPVLMPWHKRVRAIVYTGLNGQAGALATADALYGRINPCGRLAETFPLAAPDLSDDADKQYYRESLFVGYKYYDASEKQVLFPFGHGLTYSDIEYTDVKVRRAGDGFDVTVTLTNNSVRDGYEVIQVYVSDRTGRMIAPKKQLAGFKKVFVEGQTSSTATVRLPRTAFEFFDADTGAYAVADGEYAIIVAASATDIKKMTSVKIDGNYFGHKSVPSSYAVPLSGEFDDADFSFIYGELPPPLPRPVKGEFTLDSCISDLRDQTLIGKIMARVVLHKAKAVGLPGSAERRSYIESALYTPLSSVAAMSDGAISLKTAKALVEIANGRFFKGVKLLLSK